MTTDNLTTVERIYDAFARRDLDTIMAAMDPSVTVVQDAPLPWAGRYTGHAGLADFLGKLLSHVEARLEVGELVAAGDHIVQIGHTNGRVLSNGKEFHAREVHVWRFRDGLVTSYEVHIDVPHMLHALS
nr:nuclear transport factor 2 family protein [Kibdelosporangium sp. MJ126-NF4]CEL18211.1 Ketosteroid isomerase-related protein [Kibdelosporangium sp. MJ126-NF4]CTQ90558.1 Ketosteroid isomerase-related protein [Kibdelosporangium sp. MJ126-NF4]